MHEFVWIPLCYLLSRINVTGPSLTSSTCIMAPNRPVAVFTALLGTATDMATRAFMSWFGPKGVATMTFSLLILGDQIPGGRTIFNLAALTVFCSILAHGATDTAGADWIGDRAERADEARDPNRSGIEKRRPPIRT